MTIIYWQVGGEPVGIGGMLLAAALAGMVGFYVWFTQRRIGQILPEDNMTALFQMVQEILVSIAHTHGGHCQLL